MLPCAHPLLHEGDDLLAPWLAVWSNCGTGDTDVSQSTLSGVFPQAIDSQGRSICSNTAAWSANMDGKEMTLLCFMANGSAM